MSKSFEEMNLSEFVEYFENICTSIGLDLEDGNNFAVKALNYLKEYEGVAAVKTYTQEELNEAITKALNDMNTVLSKKDKENELYKEALKKGFKELELYKIALRIACSQNNTNPVCATAYQRDNCMLFGSCGECWEHVYLQEAREQSDEKNILL